VEQSPGDTPTQSSVSQAIASLEAELGVSLLTRGPEGVTLTEIGARLITHVREALNRTERMHQEAAASVGPSGADRCFIEVMAPPPSSKWPTSGAPRPPPEG
jgi:DNA-binding transcriptional LysR family regulator